MRTSLKVRLSLFVFGAAAPRGERVLRLFLGLFRGLSSGLSRRTPEDLALCSA